MRPKWLGYLLLWVAMMVVRQDFWFHDDPARLLGFLPAGLAYQAAYSLLASLVMWCLVRFDWPADLEGAAEPKAGRREP